jgi:pyruvate/2-oxoglutarate dehydrogenase complex dihydrolipoamide dehydrogenase (E3) component/uncharacterized membrane protein YdjX (TVP38/TMEM64 family)
VIQASRRSVRLLAWALVLAAAALLGAHLLGLIDGLTLERLKSSRDALAEWREGQPLAAAGMFFAIYVIATGLSIPGAVILTLAGGALFGLVLGLLLVSFASSLGALLAFLLSRYLFRGLVRQRLGRLLEPLDAGLRKDGAFYLLTLRLVPLFPFWLVNLAMGLSSIPAIRFYLVSQIGMLPATFVYVNAGTQIGAIDAVGDVLSPPLLASFVLLGLLPLVVRGCLGWLQRRRQAARWSRPTRFDRNLIVIGAGAGGLVTAYVAAAARAQVTLVEAAAMGGDCLNHGCVPSKTLIRTARLARQIRQSRHFGLAHADPQVDFKALMQRVREVIARIEPHDSVERYRGLGVEVLEGRARVLSPWTVRIDRGDGGHQVLSARHIVIATGASPLIPDLPGLEAAGYLTSETVWGLERLPRRLVVLGGGPIGCELGQAFSGLGSRVTLVESAARVLGREDPDVSELVESGLREDGVQVLTGYQALRVEQDQDQKWLVVRGEAGELKLPFDELLCAVGRRPRVDGLGLEAVGVALTASGAIAVDAFLQTSCPGILAVGDVTGSSQFTHAAAHQGWHAAVNAMFAGFWRIRLDQSVMPRATFTEPEVARVGLTESEARAQGVDFEVTRYDLAELDRAIVDGCNRGFVKVLTPRGGDRILGATAVGEHASEWIAEMTLAMRHGLGLKRVLSTVHLYPSFAEANRHAAGLWRSAHAPAYLLAWIEGFHRWRRG